MADSVITKRFDGRVALVSGASREPSIGRATANRLAAEGAFLVINARSPEALARARDDLDSTGASVVAVEGAAESADTPERMVGAALDHFGRVDIVVNTIGGSTHRASPRSLTRLELMETIELNTWPALALIQAALRNGLGDGGGAVVNVSSGTVNKTTPMMIAYAAAKAALNAMTRTLARDLASEGIRVNAVAPGLTRTSATRSTWEADGGAHAGAQTPLGRMTSADDVAAAVCFLLSDEAASITGVIIDVDSGNHLQSGGWTPITDPKLQAVEERQA